MSISDFMQMHDYSMIKKFKTLFGYRKKIIGAKKGLIGIGILHPGQTQPTRVSCDKLIIDENHVYAIHGDRTLVAKFWLDSSELTVRDDLIKSASGLEIVLYIDGVKIMKRIYPKVVQA